MGRRREAAPTAISLILAHFRDTAAAASEAAEDLAARQEEDLEVRAVHLGAASEVQGDRRWEASAVHREVALEVREEDRQGEVLEVPEAHREEVLEVREAHRGAILVALREEASAVLEVLEVLEALEALKGEDLAAREARRAVASAARREEASAALEGHRVGASEEVPEVHREADSGVPEARREEALGAVPEDRRGEDSATAAVSWAAEIVETFFGAASKGADLGAGAAAEVMEDGEGSLMSRDTVFPVFFCSPAKFSFFDRAHFLKIQLPFTIVVHSDECHVIERNKK